MAGVHQSLQHAEAVARFELLRVGSYDVRLDLAGDERTFGSHTTIRFDSRGGGTFLDLKPVAVRSIRLDGHELDPALLDRGRMPLQTTAGTHELFVEATMAFRNDGEGLHAHVDPADGRRYVYGMSFMDAAPSIFACFDQPDLKAPYTFRVTTPPDWVVVGNGRATQVEPGVWETAPTEPLSTYFVTLVAGPYHVIRSEHDGIALGLSVKQSLAAALDADAEELFTMTGQCFDEMHRLFGIRYPFGDYHQAFVPEFNAGAMENPGCVTFRDPLVFGTRVTRGMRIARATTVAHEMAHQWFGNIVTPKWWDDLWLNESFAEYLGNRVTADVTTYDDAWADNAYARRLWGLTADLGPGTHPVAGNGAVDATAALQDFDGISYAKGSAVIKQLANALGDEVFFAGVRDHLERHRFGNATMADLVGSWERAGAEDVAERVAPWLLQPGPDVIELDRAAGVLRLTPPQGQEPAREHAFVVAAHRDGRWHRDAVVVRGTETAYETHADVVVLDADQDTWAAMLPDHATITGLVDLLPELADPMIRSAVWNNVRTGLLLGRLDPAAVVPLVVAAPPVEDTEDVPERANPRRTLPWVFQTLLPLAPEGSWAQVHEAMVREVERARPGSERQLAAFRSAVRSAADPGALRSWLTATPDGVDLDADLRWRLLVRLATLGATDRAELDAARAEDPTGLATVEHTRAVSSLPTAEGKAFAWERFLGEVRVANYELEAAGLGMWRTGQEEVTEPYVDRYFAEVATTAHVRSGWVLAETAEAFFPATVLRDDVVERAHGLLAQPDLDLSIRRRVGDATDRLERMLAVRRAFS